jgi:hypothetical protein
MTMKIKTALKGGACLILRITALLVLSCGSPMGGGGGSGVTPATIQIAGPADLAKIGKNAAFPLDGSYTLTGDIAVNNWTPIGAVTAPFTGTFDGGGKTITITGSGGLFESTRGATIRNLTIEGVITMPVMGSGLAGSIAGLADKTTIVSCRSRAAVTLNSSAQSASAGGIAGYVRNSTVISDCETSGTITLNAPQDGRDLMVYAGGIAGYAGGSTISRCASRGNISAAGDYPYAGGLVGYNYSGARIKESFASGNVAANGGNLPYAGGVAGYNSVSSSKIENCYARGTVRAVSSSGAALAGGIAGANARSAVISTCYAAGEVSVQVALGGSFQGNGVPAAGNAGGIAGAQYVENPIIEKCAALNADLSGSGGTLNIKRIGSAGTDGSPAWTNNKSSVTGSYTDNADGGDGADCGDLAQNDYTAWGWDFTSVWKMGTAKPELKWQ